MRLEILKKSLEKKQAILEQRLGRVFGHQSETNGQPMNDKRDGGAWFNNRDKLDDAVRNAMAEIEKTERAIERETNKIKAVENVKETLPKCLLEAIERGEIIQWRKFPKHFFVAGVDKARFTYNVATKKEAHFLTHKYAKDIPNDEQFQIFKTVYNRISKELKGE